MACSRKSKTTGPIYLDCVSEDGVDGERRSAGGGGEEEVVEAFRIHAGVVAVAVAVAAEAVVARHSEYMLVS